MATTRELDSASSCRVRRRRVSLCRHDVSSGVSSREREQLQISCLFVGTRQDRRIDAATAATRDVIPASVAL